MSDVRPRCCQMSDRGGQYVQEITLSDFWI